MTYFRQLIVTVKVIKSTIYFFITSDHHFIKETFKKLTPEVALLCLAEPPLLLAPQAGPPSHRLPSSGPSCKIYGAVSVKLI